jgi:hypothetical protein
MASRTIEQAKAIVHLQKLVRGYRGRREARLLLELKLAEERRLLEVAMEKERVRQASAIKIQKIYRGRKERKLYKVKLRRHRASIVIQCAWRRHKSKLVAAMMKIRKNKREKVIISTFHPIGFLSSLINLPL